MLSAPLSSENPPNSKPIPQFDSSNYLALISRTCSARIRCQTFSKSWVEQNCLWLLDYNHDVDLFFLHCRHVDFVTSSCRFQAPQILCSALGLLVSDFFSIFLAFFSFPTDPPAEPKSGNVFDSKRKIKMGWPYKYIRVVSTCIRKGFCTHTFTH